MLRSQSPPRRTLLKIGFVRAYDSRDNVRCAQTQLVRGASRSLARSGVSRVPYCYFRNQRTSPSSGPKQKHLSTEANLFRCDLQEAVQKASGPAVPHVDFRCFWLSKFVGLVPHLYCPVQRALGHLTTPGRRDQSHPLRIHPAFLQLCGSPKICVKEGLIYHLR